MAAFTYFYKIRIDVTKSSSGEELLSKWHEEAQAALGLWMRESFKFGKTQRMQSSTL